MRTLALLAAAGVMPFLPSADALAQGRPQAAAALPVLPGACGYGTAGPIARGKPIFTVTTTAATGEGSLHAAVQAAHQQGGGVIVFETSGVIDVERAFKSGYLVVEASDLWIAGQTAPAPGIFVRGGLLLSGRDFLIQHLGVYRPAQRRRESDTISLHGTNRGTPPGRAIFDHTAAWGGNDGNLDIALYAGGSVTVQHSILAVPLRGGHPKADAHNFNSLIYGGRGDPARITYRLNLFSTALDRQPLSSFDELVIVNNVYYNRQPHVGRYVYLRNAYQNGHGSQNSIVGNVFWDTARQFARLPILLRGPDVKEGMLPTSRIHLADNAWNLCEPPVARDQWGTLVYASGNPRKPLYVRQPPVWNEGLEALPSGEVVAAVRAQVGPRPAERVPFLAMLVDEVGEKPRHGFPSTLEEIDGELRGLPENRRVCELPDKPDALEADGYTALEHLLFAMAREVEGER